MIEIRKEINHYISGDKYLSFVAYKKLTHCSDLSVNDLIRVSLKMRIKELDGKMYLVSEGNDNIVVLFESNNDNLLMPQIRVN